MIKGGKDMSNTINLNKYNRFSVIWGIQLVYEKGCHKMANLTDDDINEIYEQDKADFDEMKAKGSYRLYVPEVTKEAFVCARELAQLDVSEFVRLIQDYDIFPNPKEKIKYERLMEIARGLVQGLILDDRQSAYDYMMYQMEMDEDEAYELGCVEMFEED